MADRPGFGGGAEVAPRRFRKRPVVIDAMLLTADNAKAVCDWVHGFTKAERIVSYHTSGAVAIETLEGVMTASVGDYVIRGVQGEPYPCKPDIFEATYEPVAEVEPDLHVKLGQRDEWGVGQP